MNISIKKICSFFDKTRQAFYKSRERAFKCFLQEQSLLSAVKQIRKEQPRVGSRKLWLHLKKLDFNVGRDRLFNILRKNGLLIKPKKRYTTTTNSHHWFKKYTNLTKGVELTGPGQVYVADITYIRLKDKFAYLSLLTDAWSHKIVGWDLSLSLSVEGALRTLKMALKVTPYPEGLIHHSDRGIQYCCYEYTDTLKKNDIMISMTEDNHCYENAIAERVNGILKDEFYLGDTLPSFTIAKELVADAVFTYNTKRLHMSNNYKTPKEVHHY